MSEINVEESLREAHRAGALIAVGTTSVEIENGVGMARKIVVLHGLSFSRRC